MKKLPLFFCCLFVACAEPKLVTNNTPAFNTHQQPYRVASVGKWNHDYSVITLIDAKNNYFTVKTPYAATLKRGDTYSPENTNYH